MENQDLKIGDIVRFKGRGVGMGKIITITSQKKRDSSTYPEYKNYSIYHVTLLNKDTLVACYEEHIEKLPPEDDSLVRALDSIGNL